MSILGKIFTVLVLVASVGVCMILIGHAYSTENWRQRADENALARRQAVQAVKTYQSALADLNAEYSEMKSVYLAHLNAKDQRIASLQADKSQLQKDKGQQAGALVDLNAQLTALNDRLAELQKEKNNLESQRAAAVSRAGELAQANDGLNEQVSDYRRQVADLTARLRDLQNRVSKLQNENAFLTKHFEGELPEKMPALPTVDLAGVVREVDMNRGIAVISLGSSDQVVPGMTFIVSRGDDYLGDLKVTSVEENSAVGVLTSVGGTIRRNDYVAYEFRR